MRYSHGRSLEDPKLPYEIGMGFLKGEGEFFRSDEFGIKWLERAVKMGYAPAMVSLGDCYRDGSGTTFNPALAIECYRSAAAKGDSIGQFRLGTAYLNGYYDIVRQNPEEAFKYLNNYCPLTF